ncbi:helix-turn-helix domain-containing protein [Microbacterium sp. LRZ72]|uniref:helix-turn-helix domain-containing protein n=1 Tax=Microbacterium sp. LRZ72 TaxID=2942481 RepID=UPI0029AD6944|nr:helix-turn-helix domain-containing protein [Microbacterium sp. LRZ72]MDX2377311.1 helix-turn-helix domain-containing protein [Microbacterium sp. LRZ72]
MTSTLLTRGTVLVDEALQESATEAVEAAADEKIVRLTLTTSTGREVSLAPAVVDLVAHVLQRVAQGGELTMHTVPEILTTSAAADFLGVSRPTLMKLIRNGELEPIMVGTHHRLRLEDVAALRAEREKARRMAVAELLELEDD